MAGPFGGEVALVPPGHRRTLSGEEDLRLPPDDWWQGRIASDGRSL